MIEGETQNLTTSEVDEFCRAFIINGDVVELRQIISQINKVNLHLNVNLIYNLIRISIALYKEEKITYHKILVLLKSILELNYVDNRIILRVFEETLNWLNLDYDSSTFNSYFDLIFNLMNYSQQARNHILNNFSHSLLKISQQVPFNDQINENTLHERLMDYLSTESKNVSATNKQLNNILLFLIKYFQAKNKNITNESIFWYLIGRILSTSEIGTTGPSFGSAELSHLEIFNDLSELHHVLYHVLHSQPENTSSNTIAKILFSFSGLVINNFGFQFMMDILSYWYEMEENMNFRYGFHLTYISLITNRQNPEMTLNFCSAIISKEQDPDLLIKVVFNLYELGIGWKLIYPFIILPLIHNNELEDNKFKEKISSIYKIYFNDLMKSHNSKLLSKTEDLFLIFWSFSGTKQKRQMNLALKKWIDSAERTNTIKGIFIKSLILRTTESSWINILNNYFSALGRMSVEILDDDYFYNSTITIGENKEIAHIHTNNRLSSILRNNYCMACKSKLNAKDNKICDVCKFTFCQECSASWEHSQYFEEDNSCLGSALSGVHHKFRPVTSA